MSKILIVDDSVSVRKALERILKDFDVSSAESAEQALQILNSEQPALIIADVVMPGMDGFELTQVLKADDSHKHLPVILISGIVNDSVQEQAAQVGALEVVKKPFNPTDLLPTINKALQNSITAQDTADTTNLSITEGLTDSSFSAIEVPLKPFLAKEDIESALLVTIQGDCLLNLGKDIDDPATFAGYFKFFASAARILGDKLEADDLNGVLLEYKNKVLLMQRVNEEVSVVLVLRDMTVLSVARFLLNKQLPAIETALYAAP